MDAKYADLKFWGGHLLPCNLGLEEAQLYRKKKKQKPERNKTEHQRERERVGVCVGEHARPWFPRNFPHFGSSSSWHSVVYLTVGHMREQFLDFCTIFSFNLS